MNLYLKEIVKRIYEVFYYLFRFLPVKENRIIFESFSGKNISCNPKAILNYMIENNYNYEYIVVHNYKHNYFDKSRNIKYVRIRSIKYFYYYATSKIWVLNTNHIIVLKPKKNQIYLQTWHAAGAFKKFGKFVIGDRKLEMRRWMKDAKNWTYLLCSSENVRDIYADSFDISKDIIKCTGIPRNDIFLNKIEKDRFRNILNKKINNFQNKKVILYAPTFRDNKEFNLELDFKNLYYELKDEYKILLKLHPNIAKDIKIDREYSEFIYDYSKYEDTQELLLACDLLITDYSSIIFDYAITGNPIVFYSYDLDDYINLRRGFYFEYESFVPGPIVYNQSDLIATLKNYKNLKSNNFKRVIEFAQKYNKNSEKICVEEVIEIIRR